MQPIIGIYKIVSPTERVYIGQSTNIQRRKLEYRACNGNIKSQVLLFRSINKYVFDKHTFEIVEECAFEELNNRERHWQDHYNVLGPKGLNCVLVDALKKPKKYSEETKDKMRQKAIGRKHSEETKAKLSKSKTGVSLGPKTEETKLKISIANKGRVLTEEHKNKISKSKKGTVCSEATKVKMSNSNKRMTARKIDKLDLNGNYIETYNSLKEAAESCGGKSSHIPSVANGKRNSTLGFKWRYNND